MADSVSGRHHQLPAKWHNMVSESSGVFKSFLAGTISGTCSTVIFQPLDLIKTRVQSSIQSRDKPMRMIEAFKSVVQSESVFQLWRGTVPSLARCVPGIGIYFASLYGIKTTLGVENLDMLESAVIGGTARTVAGLAVLPFTVVKTRFESKTFGYKSVAGALSSIYKTEGMKGLFSGLIPTLLRDVPYSGLYLMFYSKIKHSLPNYWLVESHTPAVHFCSGVVAGVLASLSTQPADVLKTHSQLYPQKFNSLKTLITYVYQHDGMAGFFRGVVPRTIKRTLVGAMAWTVYEELMEKMGLKTV